MALQAFRVYKPFLTLNIAVVYQCYYKYHLQMLYMSKGCSMPFLFKYSCTVCQCYNKTTTLSHTYTDTNRILITVLIHPPNQKLTKLTIMTNTSYNTLVLNFKFYFMKYVRSSFLLKL